MRDIKIWYDLWLDEACLYSSSESLKYFDSKAWREVGEAMDNNGIKLVCINYKKSDIGNKVKQKLVKK